MGSMTPQQRAWRAYLESTLLLFDALDHQLQRDCRPMPHAYFEILGPPLRDRGPHDADERPGPPRHTRPAAGSRMRSARLEEPRLGCSGGTAKTDRRGQTGRAGPTQVFCRARVRGRPGTSKAVRRYVIDRLTPEQIAQLTEIGESIVAATRETLSPASPAVWLNPPGEFRPAALGKRSTEVDDRGGPGPPPVRAPGARQLTDNEHGRIHP